ncbi:MAG: isoprenylcysteine carboxylmethyltransferase family protein [Chromatiales bacterium]|nr:isoprenylcysteine carboxylmethyltransferase family protein [Chromatiales bacterium]
MKPAALLKFRAVPPAWIVPAALLSWALHTWAPVMQLLERPLSIMLALLAFAASLLLTGQAAKTLARHDTTIYPNGESTRLVTAGPFRFTRNPMYLGMTLIVLGVALLLGSLTALLGVPFFMLAVQQLFIIPEEQRLGGWFGEDYRRYCARVARWLPLPPRR